MSNRRVPEQYDLWESLGKELDRKPLDNAYPRAEDHLDRNYTEALIRSGSLHRYYELYLREQEEKK